MSCALTAIVAIDLILMIPLHQLIQGRDAMPRSIVVALWSSEIIYRRRRRIDSTVVRQLLLVTGVGGAAVQITGRSIAARRNSVGINGPWLYPSAEGAWSPPARWPLLILVAILACSPLAASVARYAAQGGRSKDLVGTDPAAVALYVGR